MENENMDIDLTCLDELETVTILDAQDYCETCHKDFKTCEVNMEKDLKELNSGKKGRGKRTTKINCSRECKTFKNYSLKHVLVKYKAAETPESKIEVKKEFENNPLSKVVSGEQSLAKNLARVQDPSLKPEDSNYFNLVIALAAEADKKRKSADEFLDLMKELDPESLAYIIYSLNQRRFDKQRFTTSRKKAKITE
ncbi:hypothetical protein ACTFIW_007470 [Dictyostelium discoideum]